MADVDLSDWPVVAVRLDDPTSTADLAALAGAVISALERRRPFGLLIRAQTPLPDADVQAEPVRWLRRRRTEIGTWCRAVVYVLPDRAAARFSPADRAAAQRLWGCDVEAVHDQDAGRAWLLAHLDPDART